jgi:hypothetical protein
MEQNPSDQTLASKKKRHVGRNIAIVIGGLFAVLMVAALVSPSDPKADAPVSVTSQAGTPADNGPTPDPVAAVKTTQSKDDQYLTQVRKAYPVTSAIDDATLTGLAASTCSILEDGGSRSDLDEVIGQASEWQTELTAAVTIGVNVYCPQQASKLNPAKPTASAKPKVTKPAMTASQEQAVGTAGDYLEGQSFSRKGLIEQLQYEGFSAKDATYGVDHVKVNWNTQAVGVAKGYLDGQHFSRSGLIEQLEYEGFTHAQAVYGVTKAGL